MSELMMTPEGAAALEGARAVVVLVGGYDGSANYGDIAQLDAAIELTERLGPRVAVVPVIESLHRETHARLYPDAAQRRALAATAYFAREPTGDLAGLVPAQLPAGLRAGAAYLYGGGYVNAQFGPRRLAMLGAADTLLRAAGVPLACVVTSGLQIDADWVDALDPAVAPPLRHVRRLGVRDDASAAALAGTPRVGVHSGDDAVGFLAPWAGTATPDGQVNVHVTEAGWVTGDGERLLRHQAALLGALAGPGTRVQPIVAYDDPYTSELPAVERLRALCAGHGVTGDAFADPLLALPGNLERLAPVMARARLTLTSSYHVALTSLLIGVPAALVTENPYYVQKSAGLRADFGLPAAFALDPDADPQASAQALRDALPEAQDAVARAIGPVLARRLRAERDVLGELAGGLIAAIAESPGEADAGALALARLRADLQTAVYKSHADGRRAEVLEANLADARATHVSEMAAAEQRLAARGGDLTSERNARMWFEQALAAAQQSQGAERALAQLMASRSWRLTGPLRALAHRVRGGGGRGAR